MDAINHTFNNGPLGHDAVARRQSIAIEAMNIGIFEYVVGSQTAFWDARAKDLFGIAAHQVMTYDDMLTQIHPDDRDQYDKTMEGALDAEGSHHLDVEFRIQPRDGAALRWITVAATCMVEDGAPTRLIGTIQDVTRRRVSEERNKLLRRELQHRIKNILATTIAVVEFSRQGMDDLEAYAQALTERLKSMASAHDMLDQNDWSPAYLASMVHTQLKAYLGIDHQRVVCNGSDIMIGSDHVLIVSLALHELMTNAMKYGALSNEAGQIFLDTEKTGDEVRLTWKEKGGPPIEKSNDRREGFGSFLIQNILPEVMDAQVDLSLPDDGALFQMTYTDKAKG